MASDKKEAWIAIQKKTFTKWSNSHLRRKYAQSVEPLTDIETQFEDGLYVYKLIHALYDTPIPKHNANPKMRPHKLDNLTSALKMIEDAGIKTHFLKTTHLVDHDLKMILGMIWTIILDYQIKGISVEELSAKEGLLLWCQKKTAGYKDVDVQNFHLSFQDGLAFCALIHRHRPDLLNFDELSKDNPRHNLQLAFDVAEEKLGIPKLLDVEDLVDVPRPDERSVMTYVSEYFHCFANQNAQEVAGRRIAKVVNLTRLNNKLKAQYVTDASALAAWIKATTERFRNTKFDNTLAGVQGVIAAFDDYRKTEKPPKTQEKLNVEILFNNLSMKLRANNRAAFQPDAGLSVAEISDAWKVLEQAERDLSAAAQAELLRQEKLEALATRFNTKAALLSKFANGKKNVLESQAGQTFSTVGQVQVSLQGLDAFDTAFNDSKARLETAKQLGGELIADNYRESAAIKAKIDELDNLWANVHSSSASRRSALETELDKQQKQEAARKEFAQQAKAFERFLKDASENARDYTSFGDTLEDVEAYRATLTSSEQEVLSSAGAKRAALDEVDALLKALGVVDNQYTHITVDSINQRQENLKDLLSKRHQAYEAELARQQNMEAKRKEFAAAASGFVDYLAQQRAAISAIEGEPESQKDQLNAAYSEADGNAKLDALRALDNENRALGIVYNKHTNLSIPGLEARWNAFKAFVKHTGEDIDQSIDLKQKAAASQREFEHQRKLEDLKIDFANRAAALNIFYQNTTEVLSEPVTVSSVEAVRDLQATYDAAVAPLAQKEQEKNDLVSFNNTLVAEGITENKLSELTAAEAEEQFSSLSNLASERKGALAAETQRQIDNEALRVEFANAGAAASAYLDQVLASSTRSEGSVEDQLAALEQISVDRATVDAAKAIANNLATAGVRDNKHTSLSIEDLEVKYSSISAAVSERKKALASEIAAKEHGQVPPEQLKEIHECFTQFDKDNTGNLAPYEFKACLSALGESISDTSLEIVLKEYANADGRVDKDGFTKFMIQRLSDTDTEDQILKAFKVLAGDADFVTEQQLRIAFAQDQESLEYILANIPPKEGIEGGYDFAAFTSKVFSD